MSSTKKPIHKSIKEALGYPSDCPDRQFLEDWKKRSTRVCKPCWELKYCPYGPFVEQSPLLPPSKPEAITHHKYLKEILKTGFIGTVKHLDDTERREIEELIAVAKEKPEILAKKVIQKIWVEEITKLAEKEGKDILEYFQSPDSNIEKYNVPYPLGDDSPSPIIEGRLEEAIKKEITELEEIARTGIDDQRQPLDQARRKSFESEVSNFDENKYPPEIPQIVLDMQCKNFGHICPVVFVGESISETANKRRYGRHIPFSTKIRVVRRDNYTCQECGTPLKDDEVEFDHIIPLSKGGSSEEYNIRLTCFSCNRRKSNNVDI